jgi:hypothetical protein
MISKSDHYKKRKGGRGRRRGWEGEGEESAKERRNESTSERECKEK